MYEIIVAVYKIVIEGTFYKCKIHGSLMVVSIKFKAQLNCALKCSLLKVVHPTFRVIDCR